MNIQANKEMVWPKGGKLILFLIYCILASIPFVLTVAVRSILQIILVLCLISKIILMGIMFYPCVLAKEGPECGFCTIIIYIFILPFLIVGGIFKSFIEHFCKEMGEIMSYYKMHLRGYVKCFFYPWFYY